MGVLAADQSGADDGGAQVGLIGHPSGWVRTRPSAPALLGAQAAAVTVLLLLGCGWLP
jgi:hypothetical protein